MSSTDPIAAPPPEEPTHCPYRQASLLQQALAPGKMRVAFLLGAGCPAAVRPAGGPLIPDVAGLTLAVTKQLEGTESAAHFSAVLARLGTAKVASPTIEDILTHIRALRAVVGGGEVGGLTADHLASLDAKVCEVIGAVVKAQLPDPHTPYHDLATWVGAIGRTALVEIFTPNYDLLMEQGLEEREVPYFDGFVGGDRTFFDLPSMEQDRLPPRWARLWKLHGSINWWMTPGGRVERRCKRADDLQLMIHPSHLKYMESRKMPFLAMLDRLRSFLSAGQAVLVTCGYSFSDAHVNAVILQALRGNSSAICFGLIYGDRSSAQEAVALARGLAHLNVLAADGAVIGTVERDWHASEQDHALAGVAVRTGDIGAHRSKAPADRCKLVLGDFASLGEFLAHQLGEGEPLCAE